MAEDTARGGTATIKFGTGHDVPWYTPSGSPEQIREQIIVAFGYDGASVAEVPLSELIVMATLQAQGLWVTGRDLGAKPVSVPASAPPSSGPTGAAAWAAAGSAPAADDPPFEPNVDPLIASINQVESAQALALIWQDNKERFAEDDVKAAAAAAQKRLA